MPHISPKNKNPKGMMALGMFIKERRKKMGLTQSDIAQDIHVNESYLSRLEMGDRFQTINLDIAYRLAKKLDLTIDDIAKVMGIL